MFWHYLATRAPAGLRRLLAAASFGLLFLFGGTAPASAGTDSFCNKFIGYNEVCTGPIRNLTASRGTNNSSGSGCGGEAYGEYFCATPAGCRAWNGAALRTPAIRHKSTTSKSMSGYSTWGGTPQPAYCDPGVRYAALGPVTTTDPTGVPVLADRERETAPSDVAELWPTADPDAARHFETPQGDGWVLTIPADRKVCLAVSDQDGGYGYSCQGYNDARLRGSLVTFEDSDLSSAKGDLAVALPAEGTDGLEVTRRDGSVRTVPADDGVVAVELRAGDAAISLDANEDTELSAQRVWMGRRG